MRAEGTPSRRQFIRSGIVAGGWFLGIGPGALAAPAAGLPAAAAQTRQRFNAYLSFLDDGSVEVFTTVTNLGQGTHAAITQMVMEELALPAERIRVEHAPVERAYHQDFPPGITTFASAGFGAARKTVAPACAAAREMLIQAAATRWQVQASDCHVKDAHVVHVASGRREPYTALYLEAAALPAPRQPRVKAPAEWTVLGRSLPRPDIPSRVDGSARFGIDVRLPGMLYAAVVHAPRFGETLASVDESPARRVAGVHKVVRLPAAVAVIADSYWSAQQACQRLRPRWKPAARPVPDSGAMRRALNDAVQAGQGMELPVPRAQDSAATATALAEAAWVVDQTFEAPFLAHACMEPLNATVQVTPQGAQVWLSTQSQTDTQRGVAAALGLATEQVTVHSQAAGGGFGRRLEQDFAVEAALIARAVNVPVQTLWSRENDMRAGFYRPMTTARLRLALDAQGLPLALRSDMASPSLLAHTQVTNSPPLKGYDWTVTMGLPDTAYRIPKYDTRWTRVEFGVPCAYWRSVGNSQNTHFLEHCLELAARHGGQDSIAYRRRLLAHNPPGLAFLDAFAERARWAAPLPPGHFRGFAMNGLRDRLFSAHIVEVAVTAPGRFRLVRVAAAIDPGVAGNPMAVERQLQSGTIFGLAAALFGEVTFKDGRVEQGNFNTYRLPGLGQMPPLEVFVLPHGGEPQGVGEEGPPSVIAALANALLAAGGRPVASLPVSRSGWALDEGGAGSGAGRN
jgi:isoquinoline 1-oxidoreductase beta subunit